MKRRKNEGNFITSILILLIIFVFSITVYFCLDVFGIIVVPEKYSIASLFYSQIDIIATQGEIIIEDAFPENIIEEPEVKEEPEEPTEIVVELNSTEKIPNRIEELERLQAERRKEQEANKQEQVINAERFYYNQLDEYGKTIYDKLYLNMEHMKTGTYTAQFDTTFDDLLHQENGSDILNNSFQLAINALTFDNPELFYIDITKINLITEITTRAFSTTYRVSIGGNGKNYLAEEFPTVEAVYASIALVDVAKEDIVALTTDNEIENLKIVHDYLIDNTVYDTEHDSNITKNSYNVYGTLIGKRAVCEGYARTYKSIMDDLGIPCIIACGVGKNNSGETESHAWNYVYVKDNWYAIDVTWDDPIIIGNGSITNEIRYRYFLKGADQFFTDHFEDGNIAGEYSFKYPMLSTTNY